MNQMTLGEEARYSVERDIRRYGSHNVEDEMDIRHGEVEETPIYMKVTPFRLRDQAISYDQACYHWNLAIRHKQLLILEQIRR
ncbi:hypothetical protein K7432_018072 [Basidiobolus ranarum]|uniref:Uncharacterized protein n=1 Tax=Basidiobolus ranarum TaxID=34480 RepID=A0ABR2VJS7_9FUNG